MIPEDAIADIRSQTDIVALIGESVRLTKRGANHVGLCPFHNEKTPSFNVHGARGFFHCFGCQASGDAIGFVMRLEGVSFPEAARSLAERAGMELPASDRAEDAAAQRAQERKQSLYGQMETACAFYEAQLKEHPQRHLAEAELERRGVTAATAETFRLGFAPPAWDGLVKHLQARQCDLRDAESLGLIARRRTGDGYYDRFRNRLQFPVADASGRVVAFSGRMLAEPAAETGTGQPARPAPKYVNSPEGPLYHKGALLFGLHQARVEIRRRGWALLCEGNFDLIALHQAGFPHVVAPLGTAFTQAQADALARFASRVTLVFDGDAAGDKAARAAHPLLQKARLPARVVTLPAGDDPDSLLRRQGPDAMASLVDQAPGIVEHLIDSASMAAGSSAADRAQAIEGLGPIIAAVDNPVEIQLYIDRVAQRFGMSDPQAVRQQLRRGVLASRRPRPRSDGAVQRGSNDRPERTANVSKAANFPKMETQLLGLLLDQPDLFDSEDAKKLEELLTRPELRGIFRTAAELFQKDGVLDASTLVAGVDAGAGADWLRQRLSIGSYQDRDVAMTELGVGVRQLAMRHTQDRMKQLRQEIAQAHQVGDHDLATRLTRQRDELLGAHRSRA